MNKEAFKQFLESLEEFSSEKDNIRRARQECFKNGWDQITLEKIEFGIGLYHNKPCLLRGYINEVISGI